MDSLFPYAYQATRVIDADEFVRVLSVVNLEGVLYPTAQSTAMESAKSDFEHGQYNEYDMSCENQVQRRIDCANTRISSDAACYPLGRLMNFVDRWKRK